MARRSAEVASKDLPRLVFESVCLKNDSPGWEESNNRWPSRFAGCRVILCMSCMAEVVFTNP